MISDEEWTTEENALVAVNEAISLPSAATMCTTAVALAARVSAALAPATADDAAELFDDDVVADRAGGLRSRTCPVNRANDKTTGRIVLRVRRLIVRVPKGLR